MLKTFSPYKVIEVGILYSIYIHYLWKEKQMCFKTVWKLFFFTVVAGQGNIGIFILKM